MLGEVIFGMAQDRAGDEAEQWWAGVGGDPRGLWSQSSGAGLEEAMEQEPKGRRWFSE